VAWASSFAIATLAIILFRLDDFGNRAYPFSAMTFYSAVEARPPYNVHKPYPFMYGELLLRYKDGSTRKWFCFPSINSLYLSAITNNPVSDKLKAQTGAIEAARKTVSNRGGGNVSDCNGTTLAISGTVKVELYASVLQLPPYPTPITGFELGFRGLVGEYDIATEATSVGAGAVAHKGNDPTITIASSGINVASKEVLLAADPWNNYPVPPLIEADGRWIHDDTFVMDAKAYLDLSKGIYPVVARLVDTSGKAHDFFGGILYR
jgi:hypothetical protein